MHTGHTYFHIFKVVVTTAASTQFSVTTRCLILTQVVAQNEFSWEENCVCQLRHDLAMSEALGGYSYGF